jgi:hypothetical protein
MPNRPERLGRIAEVLDADDPPVAQDQRLRPDRTYALGGRPREGGRSRIAVRLEGVEAVVAIAAASAPFDPGLEDRTGLVRPASRGNRLPEPPRVGGAAPDRVVAH